MTCSSSAGFGAAIDFGTDFWGEDERFLMDGIETEDRLIALTVFPDNDRFTGIC